MSATSRILAVGVQAVAPLSGAEELGYGSVGFTMSGNVDVGDIALPWQPEY